MKTMRGRPKRYGIRFSITCKILS